MHFFRQFDNEKVGVAPVLKDFRSAKVEEVLHELSVDPNQGLTEAEANRRLEIYGFNEVPKHRINLGLALARKFWGLTAWMLEAVKLLLSFLCSSTSTWIRALLEVSCSSTP